MTTDNNTDDVEQIVERIQAFSEEVVSPRDWMIVVPYENYEEVKESLDTTKDVGTYYNGISLCYGDGYEQTQIRLKRSLEKHLRYTDTDSEQ